MDRRRRRLRILMSEDRSDIAEHAQKHLRAFDKWMGEHPFDVAPRGVAHHTARYAQHCDDCGQTYWSKDKWGSHLGCPGAHGKAGF